MHVQQAPNLQLYIHRWGEISIAEVTYKFVIVITVKKNKIHFIKKYGLLEKLKALGAG